MTDKRFWQAGSRAQNFFVQVCGTPLIFRRKLLIFNSLHVPTGGGTRAEHGWNASKAAIAQMLCPQQLREMWAENVFRCDLTDLSARATGRHPSVVRGSGQM